MTLFSRAYMRPTFHLDRPRTKERDGAMEIKRGKGGGEIESLCLCTPRSAPRSLFLFPLFVRVQHTLTAQWIFNLDLISCAPDETNTDSLFTFVKAPAAAGLVPHTHTHTLLHVQTHTHTHTKPLNRRPSWGLQEEPSAQNGPGCTLPRTLATLAYAHLQTPAHCASCLVGHNNDVTR